MDIEEMKTESVGQTPVLDGEVFDKDVDEDQMLIDLMDGSSLIMKAKILLEYFGDPDLCGKSITKRDRESIGRLTIMMKNYLDEVEVNYGE